LLLISLGYIKSKKSGKTLKTIKLLLLLSLFFNIAHASIIASEDSCDHKTAQEYVLEQTQVSDCGDLCELHHLFHFMAILCPSDILFDSTHSKEIVIQKYTLHTPAFQEKSIKPPIA